MCITLHYSLLERVQEQSLQRRLCRKSPALNSIYEVESARRMLSYKGKALLHDCPHKGVFFNHFIELRSKSLNCSFLKLYKWLGGVPKWGKRNPVSILSSKGPIRGWCYQSKILFSYNKIYCGLVLNNIIDLSFEILLDIIILLVLYFQLVLFAVPWDIW